MVHEAKKRFWRDLKISSKFAVGFGLLLVLLFTITVSGHFSLQHVHQAEAAIDNGREIQRLLLTMDRSLQRAKHLQADFFINYPQVGLLRAHELYAQPSIMEAAKAITRSAQLQKLLATSQFHNALYEHQVDFKLYLSSAKRFAATSIVSFELITELDNPQNGKKSLLSKHFSDLQKDIDSRPILHEMLEEMQSSIQLYYIAKKRFTMQTVANIATKLRIAVNDDSKLNRTQKISANNKLHRITSTAQEVVTINERIKSIFKDFNLQEQNLAATAQTLMTLAATEVKQAQDNINHTRRVALQTSILIAALGLAAALIIARLLHRSITSRILRLTQTAKKLKTGDLSVTFEDSSKDELGALAHVFSAMTTQRSADIKHLHAANQALLSAQDFLETTVEERTNELKKLLDFSGRLTSCHDVPSLFRECTKLSKELLLFDFSTLMLLSPDKKKLTIRDTIGLPEKTVDTLIGTFSLLEGQGLSTHVVQQKQAATVTDYKTEKRFDVPPIIFEQKITSALCVPMMIGEEVLGIFIGNTHEQRNFSDSEISLYQSFANQAAIAIDNALHVKEIEDSEKKFRTIFDNANDAIIIFKTNGSLLEANQIACNNLGYSRQEILSRNVNDLIVPEFLPDLPAHIEIISKTGEHIFESAHLHRNSKIIPVELSCTLFEFNETPAILAVARDISERKMMEKELIKIERLESIGVLAGGIAHDFNNILASILGNINLARLDERLKSETKNLLQEAEKASIRARSLTQQLLTFAKGGEPVKEITSVTEIIQDCGDFVLRGSNVSCQYDFADDLWLVEIDKGQISQVIQNLIINSCHAMPNGGKINIHCQNNQDPQAINLVANTGKYIEITIKDRGIGIPTHIIDNIFDPYFTTKQEGSGLGLAISHSIITKHGGFIFASSTVDKGTTFSIFLPATSGKLSSQVPTDTPPEHPAKDSSIITGKVMIMDDDPMVLQVTTAMLTHLGYDIIQTTDGHEAIKLYRAAQVIKQDIDVIIMDLTIPGGMGGKEAVQEILAINPAAKVMVSSGYSNDPVMANFQQYGFQGAVIKPFQMQELQKALEKLILS